MSRRHDPPALSSVSLYTEYRARIRGGDISPAMTYEHWLEQQVKDLRGQVKKTTDEEE